MFKHFLCILTICLSLIAPSYTAAFCTPAISDNNDWTVSFFGNFKVPDNFEATEIKNTKPYI